MYYSWEGLLLGIFGSQLGFWLAALVSICKVSKEADLDERPACMLFSGQDVEGLSQESLVKKTTVAPSIQLILIVFVILADAETTNVRLDCVAGM